MTTYKISIVLGVYKVDELSLAKKPLFLLVNKIGIILRPGKCKFQEREGEGFATPALESFKGQMSIILSPCTS